MYICLRDEERWNSHYMTKLRRRNSPSQSLAQELFSFQNRIRNNHQWCGAWGGSWSALTWLVRATWLPGQTLLSRPAKRNSTSGPRGSSLLGRAWATPCRPSDGPPYLHAVATTCFWIKIDCLYFSSLVPLTPWRKKKKVTNIESLTVRIRKPTKERPC